MPGLPRFRVREIDHDPFRLIGDLTSTHYEARAWVQAGWLGDLRVGSRFVTGRWSEVGSSWAFTPDDPSAPETIADEREFDVFDGYWGERAALVLDEALIWRESAWADLDDHDHCQICSSTIDSRENARHFAASSTLRVCSGCHSAYVEPRSIDFSREGGPAA
jgi:hypothetical protein